MLKAQLIKYLEKVPDDEPLFCLRAQDPIAPKAVNDWAAHAMNSGRVNGKKVDGAMDCAAQMFDWQAKNPGLAKMPD